jgi:hypothetical protein
VSELLKIVFHIQGLTREKTNRSTLDSIFRKAKSIGFPVYPVYKLLQSQFQSKIKSHITLGTEGWIKIEEEFESTHDLIKNDESTDSEKRSDIHEQVNINDNHEPVIIEPAPGKKARTVKILTFITAVIIVFIIYLTIKPPSISDPSKSYPGYIDPVNKNRPPNRPVILDPRPGATLVSTSPVLSWDCSDPDGDPLTFDVFFGKTGSVLNKESSGRPMKSFSKAGLNYNMGYTWKIVAKDNHGNTSSSEEWNFKTGPLPDKTPPVNNNQAQRNTNLQDHPDLYVVFDTYRDVNDPYLNLRSGPGTSFSIESKLVDGDRVEILERGLGQQGRWVKIKCPSKDKTGYVNKRYLRRI